MRLLRLMMTVAGPYAGRFRSTLRVSLAATVVQAAAYAAFVPLLAALLHHPVQAGRAWLWVAVLAALVVAEGLLRVREMRFSDDYWHLVIQSARLQLGGALRAMPQQELARRAAGDLSSVIGANTATAATALSSMATLFVQIVTVPALLGVVVFCLSWRLGVVLAVAALAALPLVRRVRRNSGAGFLDVDDADADASARIVEYVQGMPVFRATGWAGSKSPLLAGVVTRQRDAQAKANRAAALPLAGAQLVVHLALVGLVAAGAALVLHAALSLPLLVAIVVAAARMAEPLSLAVLMTKLFEMANAALTRVNDVLAVPPLPVLGPGPEPERHDLELDRVTFSYDDQPRPTLREVSLTVPERSLTALVGPSGSGKTTVTRLLSRFADPQQGTVRVGGVDLRTLEPAVLLRHVAVVFQDVYLFDDTVRANIAMARPDASDAEIGAAAAAAGAHDFIAALPAGYDTRVGEIGSSLSGGERQRISIARAILKNAPVILLDEPTSALDTESEEAVQQAAERLVEGRTAARRLSTVVGADQILVLEHGEIVQRGTHAELLGDASGTCARMWAAQTAARNWALP